MATAAPLSMAEIKKLNKDKLLEYALGITQGFLALHEKCEEFNTRLAKLEEASNSPENSPPMHQKLQARVEDMERENLNNSQYLRRRQLEIWNLPTSITDASDLKKEVAQLLALTEVPITAADLDVCHKLKKDGRVIIEFHKRDLRDRLVRARKVLKHKHPDLVKKNCPKLSILESMANEYKRLDFICRQLKIREKIDKTWFYQRKLFIVDIEGNKRVISHMQDLAKGFGSDIIDEILHA